MNLAEELTLLAYADDGTPVTKYEAPKARLMSLIIDGILTQKLPWGLVLLGVALAAVLELCGISALPFAVGVYLPISASVPVFIGGVVRYLVDRRRTRGGRGLSITGLAWADESVEVGCDEVEEESEGAGASGRMLPLASTRPSCIATSIRMRSSYVSCWRVSQVDDLADGSAAEDEYAECHAQQQDRHRDPRGDTRGQRCAHREADEPGRAGPSGEVDRRTGDEVHQTEQRKDHQEPT